MPPTVQIDDAGCQFLQRSTRAFKPAGRWAFHHAIEVAIVAFFRGQTIGAAELRRVVVDLYGERVAARFD